MASVVPDDGIEEHDGRLAEDSRSDVPVVGSEGQFRDSGVCGDEPFSSMLTDEHDFLCRAFTFDVERVVLNP